MQFLASNLDASTIAYYIDSDIMPLNAMPLRMHASPLTDKKKINRQAALRVIFIVSL